MIKEFKPAVGSATEFGKDDYVKIKRGGPNYERYARVLGVYVRDDRYIFYKVTTIDNDTSVFVDNLKLYELERANLNAMQVLALQALPDSVPEGR